MLGVIIDVPGLVVLAPFKGPCTSDEAALLRDTCLLYLGVDDGSAVRLIPCSVVRGPGVVAVLSVVHRFDRIHRLL